MPHRAIIDLGTNTFHLMIAEMVNGELQVAHKQQVPVKIGEKGINVGVITEAGYERGMHALASFRKLLDAFAVEDVLAFGTSAIRDAANGNQFIAEARSQYGI